MIAYVLEITICISTACVAGLTYLFIRYVDVVFEDQDDS